jgi:hypothetical protein
MPRQTKPPCAVEGCSHASHSRGMCHYHYHRWLRGADPALNELSERWAQARREAFFARQQARAAISCTVEGCTNPAHAKGLCPTHYGRAQRGTPLIRDTPIHPVPPYDLDADAALCAELSEILKKLTKIST